MAVQCPACGAQYDVTLFQFNKPFRCGSCGRTFSLAEGMTRTKLPSSQLIIEVESIEGFCPVYEPGDRIVLDEGYRLNLQETSRVCVHSLASIMPYYVALYHGVSAESLALNHADDDPRVAYVHCLDPCEKTGGGTVTFRIYKQ